MSCRVLGRHLEAWMFNQIIKNAKKQNYEYIIAEYIPTQKNIIAEKCLDEHGFVKYNKFNNKYLKKTDLKKYIKKGTVYIAPVKKIKIPFAKVYE